MWMSGMLFLNFNIHFLLYFSLKQLQSSICAGVQHFQVESASKNCEAASQRDVLSLKSLKDYRDGPKGSRTH